MLPPTVTSDLLPPWPLIAGHSGSNSVMEWLTSAARTSTDQRTCELDRVTAEKKKLRNRSTITAEMPD